MIILNFAEIKTHFDSGHPFEPQLAALLEKVPLTPEQWQTVPLLINPPAYNYMAVLLLAELHGRTGYHDTIRGVDLYLKRRAAIVWGKASRKISPQPNATPRPASSIAFACTTTTVRWTSWTNWQQKTGDLHEVT